MTRRLRVVLLIVLTVVVTAASQVLSADRLDIGTIKGIAMSALRQPLPDYFVRLRSLDTARLVNVARTNSAGAYEFTNVAPGTYCVEVLDRTNRLISSDGPIVVSTISESSQKLRITLISAAAGSIGAIAIGTLRSSGNSETFKSSAPEVVDAAASVGIKDGVTAAARILPSSPR